MWGYGHDWGMMGGWGGGGLSMILWPLIVIALVVGVVWFVRSPSYASGGRRQLPRHSAGLAILEERYARGEINREEFMQKKQEISG